MRIYVVHKIVDSTTDPETTLISAHVDESVELDLTGSTSDEATDVAQAAGFELVL